MGQLRGLLYVGFIVVMVVSYYLNNRKKNGTTRPEKSEQSLSIPDSIEDALKHSNWTIRLQAVQSLVQERNANIMETLLDKLTDPIIDIRQIAIAELVPYAEATFARISEILENGNLAARESAIQALLAMQTASTVPLLAEALLNDESAWVRVPAAQGLGIIGGDEACGALIRALDDSHPDVLEAVRNALSSIATPEALAALRS